LGSSGGCRRGHLAEQAGGALPATTTRRPLEGQRAARSTWGGALLRGGRRGTPEEERRREEDGHGSSSMSSSRSSHRFYLASCRRRCCTPAPGSIEEEGHHRGRVTDPATGSSVAASRGRSGGLRVSPSLSHAVSSSQEQDALRARRGGSSLFGVEGGGEVIEEREAARSPEKEASRGRRRRSHRRRARQEEGWRTEQERRRGSGRRVRQRWDPQAVGMGKGPTFPENAVRGGLPAFCSNCCGSCWSRYNAPSICKMQMQTLLQQVLETVLCKLRNFQSRTQDAHLWGTWEEGYLNFHWRF
jgi:hypothetical protein